MTDSFPTRRSSVRHDAGEPLRECRHQAQADQPAPVLAEQGDVLEVEPGQPLAHPGDVPLVGVVAACGRLVGTPETDQVRRDRPMALGRQRSEEHTSELQSLMRISYAVFCLK